MENIVVLGERLGGNTMRITIRQKLGISFGAMIFIMVLSGLVSYRMVSRINRDVLKVVEVKEPLERAFLEMEINIGETAREVLDYAEEEKSERRERVHWALKGQLFPHALVIEHRTKNFG